MKFLIFKKLILIIYLDEVTWTKEQINGDDKPLARS